MNHQIKEQLESLADEDYQKFSTALIPTINNVLGVRLPKLRALAKEIAKGDWRAYLQEADEEYFEEVMLQGMVIGYVKAELHDILEYVAQFVPKINNWSVCDSFCAGLKMTSKHQAEVWTFLQPYLHSRKEYELRFGAVMLLQYYVDETYLPQVLQLLDQIRHEEYYVKMAVAWAISICYVKYPEQTLIYLKDNSLDDFTYNKALQKITESTRVDAEMKAFIRSLKRKA
ncbi:DNA alkylation repair protein [Paenibacillus sp. 1001270B_150601_E10]|uniref:DNA alkylation repair protein n=1 Tax=Paenibacillus sp. 1001270B_150601_E10 TaxID=2787079 RepID=UPI00189E25A0|nr:DNA alkylation repair protein [Paenibacillus sp. 1001270B_150601_E10]